MSGTSFMLRGDHSLSARAALRGQMRLSIFSGDRNSPQAHDSPPITRAACSGVRSLVPGRGSFT